MLDMLITGICIVLLANLLTAMIVMGYRNHDDSWLLAILLTGTTGAAVTAMIAIVLTDQPGRFVDLSLALMGLAALPVVIRVMLPSTSAAESPGDDAH